MIYWPLNLEPCIGVFCSFPVGFLYSAIAVYREIIIKFTKEFHTTGKYNLISLIVAAALNKAIGKNNRLLWHLPADLKHFKNLTTGHTVIMGRKTFESVGKPLPNRRNMVITRSLIHFEGAETASSLQAALDLCADEEEVFVIGGGEIYREAMSVADKIYFTEVDIRPDADTFFPEIDENIWSKTASESHLPDEKNSVGYTFITYEKGVPK